MAQKLTVLFVEDDPGIRSILPDLLSDDEFTAIIADNGYAAMRILTERHVDLLFTDIVMPGIGGVELAQEAMLMCPGLRVIFFTGHYAEVDHAEKIAPLLHKPIRPYEIEIAIRMAFAEPPPTAH